jgi:hypothetical protein
MPESDPAAGNTEVRGRSKLARVLDNIQKYVRVYDNGGGCGRFCRGCMRFVDSEAKCPHCGNAKLSFAPGGSFDRYTVVFTGGRSGFMGEKMYLAMSARPFHPQGFGQHGCAELKEIDVATGRGPVSVGAYCADLDAYRIPFKRLPDDCGKFVTDELKALWGVEEERANDE